MLIEIVLLVLALFAYFYHKVTRQFGFFAAQGIPFSPPSFPLGSPAAAKMISGKLSFFDVEREMVKNEFPNEKVFGYFMFGQPNFVVNDQEIAKRIMIKDFEHFTDLRKIKDANKYNNAILVNLDADEWKQMRTFVSRVLTSGKLKNMSKQMIAVGEQLEAYLEAVADKGEDVEMKDLGSKLTLDAIATAGFGIQTNSFTEPRNPFREMALTLIGAPGYDNQMMIPKFMLLSAMPWTADLFKIQIANQKSVAFFVDIIRKSVSRQMETGEESNDIIGGLVRELRNQEKDAGKDADKAANNEVVEDDFEKNAAFDTSNLKDIKDSEFDRETLLVANTLIFFSAGLDTTTTSLGVITNKMAHYPELQEKVFEEIQHVFGDEGEVTYEGLNQLKYMDWFISESFRVNSAVNFCTHDRLCTKDYRIPGTTYTIPKGRYVKIIFEDMSHDPANFVNPGAFDPENFNPANNPNKFALQVFGQGPRNCIGMRWALLVLKIGLVHILRKFKIVKNPRTPDFLYADLHNPMLFKDKDIVTIQRR